jgi:hypothetical protein
MALSPEQKKAFDDAGEQTRTEFQASWEQWTALDVARWWGRWFQATAHDRLARILLQYTGVVNMALFPPFNPGPLNPGDVLGSDGKPPRLSESGITF